MRLLFLIQRYYELLVSSLIINCPVPEDFLGLSARLNFAWISSAEASSPFVELYSSIGARKKIFCESSTKVPNDRASFWGGTRREEEQFIFPEELFSCMRRKYPFDQTAPTNRNSAVSPSGFPPRSLCLLPNCIDSFYPLARSKHKPWTIFRPARFVGYPKTSNVNRGLLTEHSTVLPVSPLIKPELIFNETGLCMEFEQPRDQCSEETCFEPLHHTSSKVHVEYNLKSRWKERAFALF